MESSSSEQKLSTNKQPKVVKVERQIHNKLSFALDLYWVDFNRKENILIGKVNANEIFDINSEIGHEFILRRSNDSKNVKRFVIGETEMIYVTQDDLNDDMVIDKQPEGTKVKRTIHNKLPFALELYWVDLKGRRDILINELNAGSVFVMDSKIGHVFILRDSKGSRDIKRFVVDGKEMIYVTRDDLDRYNENDDLKDVDSDDMEENTEKEMDEELENDEDDAHENIEDGSNKELNQDFNQDVPLALTIMNHLSTQVAVYWANDQNKQGILQGYIEPGTPTHLNSAVGNKYYVTNSKSNKKIKEFIVSKDDNMIKINRDESLVVTQVYNHCDSIVHIYWIEPDSKQEIMLASMKAGSSMDLNGYHGDEYVVRDFNLKEYQKFIVDDAHGDNPFFYILPM